jgi:subtilisin family serine protease
VSAPFPHARAARARLARAAALLAAALAALVALPASATAAIGFDDAALKSWLRGGASASRGPERLPLAPAGDARAAAATRRAEGARALASRTRPARVLVSVTAHEHLDAVARLLADHGERVRRVPSLGVVAVTARSPAELVALLADDPRVAAIEPNRVRRIVADPADNPDPETGIPFGWAFNAVNAAPALAAVGFGSQREIAVVDSGVDVTHPDLAGRIASTYNATNGGTDASDGVGHGTFVIGLISMNHDNGIGGRGAGGTTPVHGIRADNGAGEFSTESLLRAKQHAVRIGASILNMSLGGDSLTESEARALRFAFLSDVLPVAAAGNAAQRGNPIQFPAAAVGGRNGAVGIGLSVAAVRPDLQHASFSTHNAFVSIAAPGAAQSGCQKGVFSTIPQQRSLIFDDPSGCSDVYNGLDDPRGRYAYSEGTSFAAPLVAAIAALAWQAESRLRSEQVADVLQRSARQTRGQGWNEFTGHGVVDGGAAVEAARRYDVVSPTVRGSARRSGSRVRVRVTSGGDRTEAGDDLAGGLRLGIAVRVPGGLDVVAGPSRRTLTRTFRLRRTTTYVGIACDANGNCATRRLGTIRR